MCFGGPKAGWADWRALTFPVVVGGGGHVPDGDGDNLGGIRLAQVDDIDGPVLVAGVEVLLEQGLDLLDVGLVLAGAVGDEVGPQALLVDGGEDDLGHGGQVFGFGLAGLHVCWWFRVVWLR